MAIPASAQFDIFDWNPRALAAVDGSSLAGGAPNGLLYSGAVVGKYFEGADFVALFAEAKALQSGAAVTAFSLPTAAVGDTFTLELELLISGDAPDAWNNENHRIFIGLNNTPKAGAGFYVTKKGLYLASSLQDKNPMHLAGTNKFLSNASGVPQPFVLRAVVNNADGRLALYMSSADAAYDEENGSSWWLHPDLSLVHNVAAKLSPAASAGLSIVLDAVHGTDASLLIYSARLSSSLLIPVARPVAQITGFWQVALGQATKLSGASSYDKYGAALTYDWFVEQAPKGSNALLQGATRAYATSVIGPVTDSDFVTFSKKCASKDNLKNVTVQGANPANQVLSIEVRPDGLLIKPDTDGMGLITTTAIQLSVATKNALSSAYTQELFDNYVIEVASPTSAGTSVIAAGSYLFTGGTGSYLKDPIFVPDVPGPYVFSLRVNNGSTYGAKTLYTVSVTQTDEKLGDVPDSNYIFRYLPDFWNLVRNREHLAHVWSAINQVISSDLVQAWQNDYSKSIRDISRKYQRRWVNYPNKVVVDANYIVGYDALSTGSLDVFTQVAVPTTGYTTKSSAIVGAFEKTPLRVGPVLYRSTGAYPAVVYVSEIKKSGGNWQLTSSSSDITLCRKVVGGYALQNVGVNLYSDAAYNFSKVARVGDFIRTTAPSGLNDSEVVAALPAVSGYVETAAALDDVFIDKKTTWEVVRPVLSNRFTLMPYFKFEGGLTSYDIQLGDLAAISLLNPYTAEEMSINCTVLAKSTTELFVDLLPVINALNEAAVIDGVNPNKVWSEAELSDRAVAVTSFLRTRRSAKVQDLLAIPALGKSTLDASYLEGRDFTVEEERIQIVPLLEGTAKVQAQLKDAVLTDVTSWYSLPAPATLADLTSIAGATSQVFDLLIETGPNAGSYEIASLENGNAVCTAPFTVVDEEVVFSINRNRRTVPPTDNYWAEVSFFDNWRSIENNFGLMVGLPKKYLVEDNVQVDYLTVVRSLVFSFMSGPTSDNLALMTEAFINVPFVEHDSQVLSIVEPVDNRDGLIIARDQFGRDVHYRYPAGASLATNPTTQQTIEAFPSIVDRPDKLNAIDKATYDNATLPAYTRLFNVVQIDDFISNNALVESFLPGQNVITKFHTFVVQIPLNITKTTEPFALIRTYLTATKPAYTRFVLVGVFNFLDDIIIEDILTKEYTLFLKDTLHIAPFAFNVATRPIVSGKSAPFPSTPVLPLDPTVIKYFANGVVYNENMDALERYESGYQEGVLDDYSGDGSWNALNKEIDRVNLLDFDDFDILNSYLWVPILKDNTPPYDETEFIVGESICIYDRAALLADTDTYKWNASPPVIVHVGAGMHPKLPGVFSYQTNHPNTYLLLGFKREQPVSSLSDPTAVLNNYANHLMIDGLYHASLALTNPIIDMRIVGLQSGAKASLAITVPDRIANPSDRKYFLLERINQVDKLDTYNLKDEPSIINTVYIDNMSGLTSITDVKDAFTVSLGAPLSPYTAHMDRLRKQVQQYPYNPALPDNEQFVPATSAGLYYDWAGVAAPAVTPFSLDYTEIAGPISTTPTNIDAFNIPVGVAPVINAHLGVRFSRAGGMHKTHGFLNLGIQKPAVYKATWDAGTTTMRVEGCYFISPDTLTPATSHSSSTYDGDYAGSWVFVRNNANVEVGAATVAFETGVAAGPGLRTVLGIDGATQTSTGHVLNATFPGLAAGVYTVVVRQYRPFKFLPTSTVQLEIDTGELGGITV